MTVSQTIAPLGFRPRAMQVPLLRAPRQLPQELPGTLIMLPEVSEALDAVLLPLISGEGGGLNDLPPRGLARYCTAATAEEAVLLADCFRAASARCVE